MGNPCQWMQKQKTDCSTTVQHVSPCWCHCLSLSHTRRWAQLIGAVRHVSECSRWNLENLHYFYYIKSPQAKIVNSTVCNTYLLVMPAELSTFRVLCGRFLWRYVYFMQRRATAAAVKHSKVSTKRAQCVLLAIIISSLLMCSGNVELNPGPLEEIIHVPNAADQMTSDCTVPDVSLTDTLVPEQLATSDSENPTCAGPE